MDRAARTALALLLAASCAESKAAPRSAPVTTSEVPRMRPGSCHEAVFDSVAGSQTTPVVASARTPAVLGFRMLPPSLTNRSFTYVRLDVLPLGKHADAAPGEPQLVTGDEEHLRRYEATPAQLAASTVSFAFDGRDGAGRALPAGRYEVGFVVRTRSTDPACTDLEAVRYGELTTVVWDPA
jgi:hypothetical protein